MAITKKTADKPLKLGQRIVLINTTRTSLLKGHKGTISEISGSSVGVEWDYPFENGHTLDGKLPKNTCWRVHENDVATCSVSWKTEILEGK